MSNTKDIDDARKLELRREIARNIRERIESGGKVRDSEIEWLNEAEERRLLDASNRGLRRWR